MADYVADYDTLLSTVRIYCARSDSTFSSQLPVFVSLAEQRIYYGHGSNPDGDPLYSPPLRSKIMESSSTITVAGGVGTVPDNALDLRRVTRDGDQTGMQYAAPHVWSLMDSRQVTGQMPYYYTVEGTTIKVTPSYDGNIAIDYYGKLPAIGVTNKTGPMIIEHGMAYLTATMYEAMSFMQEVDLATAWIARFRSLVHGINNSALAVRAPGGRVRSVVARTIG